MLEKVQMLAEYHDQMFMHALDLLSFYFKMKFEAKRAIVDHISEKQILLEVTAGVNINRIHRIVGDFATRLCSSTGVGLEPTSSCYIGEQSNTQLATKDNMKERERKLSWWLDNDNTRIKIK
ncbi:hypothetical protein KQX54_014986 [Cotesia glomerata]|uniref:Uncharacterized protein n=1 Tax=Cotesia glomerata TaxID=32391 RepID=A0AAV7IRY6_COTGL|nr:hypothetical protein KQX54_014986 [Cotesia glomerata]